MGYVRPLFVTYANVVVNVREGCEGFGEPETVKILILRVNHYGIRLGVLFLGIF